MKKRYYAQVARLRIETAFIEDFLVLAGHFFAISRDWNSVKAKWTAWIIVLLPELLPPIRI